MLIEIYLLMAITTIVMLFASILSKDRFQRLLFSILTIVLSVITALSSLSVDQIKVIDESAEIVSYGDTTAALFFVLILIFSVLYITQEIYAKFEY